MKKEVTLEKFKEILPFTFRIDLNKNAFSGWDNIIKRSLSSMKGQYQDTYAFNRMVDEDDIILYEVFERKIPERNGELMHGLSVLHPGKVGREYFMTKGHFHSIVETAEIYLCLQGEGLMVMETPEGKTKVENLMPSTVLYVPGRWAHRSVNIGNNDLITFFVYPAEAGHDYATIEKKGFRKIILEEHNRPRILDNPNWSNMESD